VRKVEAAAWLGCGVLAGIAGLLLADLVALDATTLTFLVIPSLAAVLIARLRSIAVAFVAAIGIGLVHELLTPITALTNYRDMTPFVLAVIALLLMPWGSVLHSSREEADQVPKGLARLGRVRGRLARSAPAASHPSAAPPAAAAPAPYPGSGGDTE